MTCLAVHTSGLLHDGALKGASVETNVISCVLFESDSENLFCFMVRMWHFLFLQQNEFPISAASCEDDHSTYMACKHSPSAAQWPRALLQYPLTQATVGIM